jgi:TetR/AcrR family transcriptional regulator, transcriptional repressor for nem operon
MAPARTPGTADRILDVAERLVQSRGFNAFSYADVASTVGIRKASLHHHFATKADLGLALVVRYRRVFLEALTAIEAETDDAGERLDRYAALYGSVLRKKRMCMCGMLATDAATLPKPMRESVAEFFAENVAWLSRVLDFGKRREQLRFAGTAGSMAAFFVSSLEGAMLVAHGSGSPERFHDAARQLLATVRPESPKPKRTRRVSRSRQSRTRCSP